MSKYTAEQVRSSLQRMHGHPLTVEERAELFSMASNYAALLRERESAKAAVTDEMTFIACDQIWVGRERESNMPRMRRALEAVAPMLASARVADGWQLVPIDPTSEMFDALCDTPMIIEGEVRGNTFIRKEHHDQRYIHDSWKAMLAAAPKPETEE